MDKELQVTVEDWMSRAAAALGVSVPDDYLPLLDIARDCAHGVARPTAPLTTYLAGLAAAQGVSTADAARIIGALVAEYSGNE